MDSSQKHAHGLHREYLAAICLLNDMFENGLLDEGDYLVLEARYAAKFQPLFRYERPCFQPSFCVRETGTAILSNVHVVGGKHESA